MELAILFLRFVEVLIMLKNQSSYFVTFVESQELLALLLVYVHIPVVQGGPQFFLSPQK